MAIPYTPTKSHVEKRGVSFLLIVVVVIAVITIAIGAIIVTQEAFRQYAENLKVRDIHVVVCDIDGSPALKVYFKTVEYPVTLELYDPDNRLIDCTNVENEEFIPATLYLGLSGENVKGGEYKILFRRLSGDIYTYKMEFSGPCLTLEDISITYEILFDTAYIKTVTLKLKNTGDLPAYVYWVELVATEYNSSGIGVIDNYKEAILPDEISIKVCYNMLGLSFDASVKSLHLIVKVSDAGGSMEWAFNTTIRL